MVSIGRGVHDYHAVEARDEGCINYILLDHGIAVNAIHLAANGVDRPPGLAPADQLRIKAAFAVPGDVNRQIALEDDQSLT